jgi:hypothetical protein
LTLLDAIRRFSQQKWADPRDRVFGLLGIVREEQRIDVEYGMSPRDVMYAALMKVLAVEGAGARNEFRLMMVFEFLVIDMGLGAEEKQRVQEYIRSYVSK